MKMEKPSASDPHFMRWPGKYIGIDTGFLCAIILDKDGIKKLANYLNLYKSEFEIQEIK
jgi:hypothetical protein